MEGKGTRRRGAAAAIFAVAGLVAEREAPRASFETAPGSPSAGAAVQFQDRTSGAASAWLWFFGDGSSSDERSPTHVYGEPGLYPVTLRASNARGASETTSVLSVAAADTIVLMTGAGNPFEITLTATDPRTGHTGIGQAMPQNDVFGFFTVPDLVPTAPGSPFVPEVFVKMLDARAIPGEDFWLFWGGLTDLEYQLTVRDTVRGTVKTYENPVTRSPACLGADTSGFEGAGGTPTPTRSAATPTPTRTRTTGTAPSPTTTPTPTATPTPTVSATVDVALEARPYQWDFLAGPDIASDPHWPGKNQVTLRVGQTYRFDVFNGSPELDPPLPSHTFSGVAALGLPGGDFAPGEHMPARTITITGAMVGSYTYSCIDSSCGSSSQHDQMGGRIVVVN